MPAWKDVRSREGRSIGLKYIAATCLMMAGDESIEKGFWEFI